jgi:two-component system chemotaxis sensor kinase CheA
MNMEQALQTYIAESRSLLAEMEASLMALESDPANEDMIASVFRAAHTIKGSAGLFGLDAVVAFTHVCENVLDRVRDGTIGLSDELIEILLACGDHISSLIDMVERADEQLNDAQTAEGERLMLALCGYAGECVATPGVATPDLATADDVRWEGAIERGDALAVENDLWQISVQFGSEVLRNGMDPASFIRYLASIGRIATVAIGTRRVPSLGAIDPESCYLDFEIGVAGIADKKTVEDVFEFVREDCQLKIQPPHSYASRQAQQIQGVSGDAEMLGEILTEAGALTSVELSAALVLQDGAISASRAAAPLGQILVGQGMVEDQVVNVALEKQRQIREQKAQAAKFIRVNAEKLDELINLVGELVIAGSAATLLAQRLGDGQMQEATAVISRFVEEIREDALQLRMVAIGETFNRFHRMVRDTSRELSKDIRLEISGADTELDKTVIEKIGDPLTHLVRNAMDHGIEAAPVRAASGKPARGAIRLNAYHDSGSIVIEVSDDGGGLSRDRIYAKGIERGLVAPGSVMSDRDVFNLIFEPGFSTAAKVSNLSGRGVGMDVVKRNIQALRGTVDMDSQEGRGTTVRIRLPLTLAIIDGFLVGVGGASYVIPLDTVIECVEVSELDHAASEERSYINLRGEVLPYMRLRDQFALGGAPGRRENVVVVQYGDSRAGIVVDELMGEFQTVIKPLAKMFSGVQGISGSTILGTGSVALILDVPSLIQAAAKRDGAQQFA